MRRLAFLAVLAVLATTPSALGGAKVVGGSAVDVRQAPWSVLVLYRLGSSGSLCTGAILDPLHVLTAAHCVVDNGVPYAPANLSVRAGVTNASTPSATDSLQERAVANVRVHKGFVEGERNGGDDVSVLTLATALDLSGPTATAIALPSPSLEWKIGDTVTLAGFGLKALNTSIDGTLNGMTSKLVDQGECLPASYDTANGVLLCAYSDASSPCSGDSGGALVLSTPTPVVVGVTRAASCRGDSGASYADVTAPEILQFILGNDNPPMAPRPTGTSALVRPTSLMQVGQSVTCKAGGWTGSPRVSYEFREGEDGTVLRTSAAATYKLGVGDVGRRLFCRVLAANEGGTTFDESPLTPSAVQTGPEVIVAPTSARRGGTASVRVRLVDWARPFGKVTVCVRFSPKIGGKLCRTATPAGSVPTVVMQLKVKATAPLLRARASVSARAADGRSAIAPAFVTVR